MLNDVDIAPPIGREVLVDVRASGLCHTDLLFATHDFVPTPAVLGHEVAGIVTAVGPDVAQLRVGDHIVGSLAQSCVACRTRGWSWIRRRTATTRSFAARASSWWTSTGSATEDAGGVVHASQLVEAQKPARFEHLNPFGRYYF